MSYTRSKTVEFGAGASGGTAGYQILNADKTNNGSHVTAGITELVAGSGNFGGTVTFPDAFRGFLAWDCVPLSGANYYAVEPVNPEDVQGAFAGISRSLEGVDPTTYTDRDLLELAAAPLGSSAMESAVYNRLDASGDLLKLRRGSPGDAITILSVSVSSNVATYNLAGAPPASFTVGALLTVNLATHTDLDLAEVAITAVGASSASCHLTHADLSVATDNGTATTALVLLRIPRQERADYAEGAALTAVLAALDVTAAWADAVGAAAARLMALSEVPGSGPPRLTAAAFGAQPVRINGDGEVYLAADDPTALEVSLGAGLIGDGAVTSVGGPGQYSLELGRPYAGSAAALADGTMYLSFASGPDQFKAPLIISATKADPTHVTVTVSPAPADPPAVGDRVAIVSS